MVVNIRQSSDRDLDIIILQGEVENIELINCELDKERVELHFESFFLNGQIKRETYTVIEREETSKGYVFKKLPVVSSVYVFDKPPRYKLCKKYTEK